MDNAQYFSQVKSKIEALDDKLTRAPSMPIKTFIQKAEIQIERAHKMIDALKRVKFNAAILDEIPLFLGALRHLASAWFNIQFDKPETRKIWMEKQEISEEYRFELSAALSLAFHDDDVTMEKLQELNQGGSNADEIQILNDLVYLAQNINKEKLLAETELTDEKITDAGQLAVELGQIYAKVIVDESTSPEIRIQRDKTFTIIEDAMKEIERRAHYAFRNKPEEASLFTFSYKPSKKKKKSQTQTAAIPEPTAA